MGKPAARLSDMANDCGDPVDAPTGTVIAVSTVLINNLPAAKQDDQIIGVDMHIVMVPSPAGPVPTPLPHPFVGMIDGELSSSVQIMGKAAATVGSTATNNPSHIPTPPGTAFQKPPMNKSKIIMGSPNVLIGNGGGGSGSGSGGGEGVAESSADEAAVEEGHTLQVKFVDKGGKPITGVMYSVKSPDGETTGGVLTGDVKKSGVKEGSYEIALMAITKAEWSKQKARDGEVVKLIVETSGIDSGIEATINIWEKNADSPDRIIETIKNAKVSGDKVDAEWKYLYIDEPDEDENGQSTRMSSEADGYFSPSYYFAVEIESCFARSPILEYKDFVELELKDHNNKPIANAKYIVYLSNGEVREGSLDGNGYKKIDNVPPGKWSAKFPDYPLVYMSD